MNHSSCFNLGSLIYFSFYSLLGASRVALVVKTLPAKAGATRYAGLIPR